MPTSSFRTFNSPGGQVVNGVSYLYDTISGVFRPIYTSDFSASVTVGDIAVTGGQIGPKASATVSNDTVSGAAGLVLASNTNRNSFFIQNLHTGALMVRFSSSPATSSNMNLLLKGGTAINDGLGSSYHSEPTTYLGPVSVSGYGGAPVSYLVWET